MTKTIQKVNNSKYLFLYLLSACCIIMMSGCTSKDDEAKKLGFSGYEEMEKIKILGFNTKIEYEESLAKKKIEQDNLEKLKKEEEEKIAKDKEIQEQNIAEAAQYENIAKEMSLKYTASYFDKLQNNLFENSNIKRDDMQRKKILSDSINSKLINSMEYSVACNVGYKIGNSFKLIKNDESDKKNIEFWTNNSIKLMHLQELENANPDPIKVISDKLFQYYVKEGKKYADGQIEYSLNDSNTTLGFGPNKDEKFSRAWMWITSCNMAAYALSN